MTHLTLTLFLNQTPANWAAARTPGALSSYPAAEPVGTFQFGRPACRAPSLKASVLSSGDS